MFVNMWYTFGNRGNVRMTIKAGIICVILMSMVHLDLVLGSPMNSKYFLVKLDFNDRVSNAGFMFEDTTTFGNCALYCVYFDTCQTFFHNAANLQCKLSSDVLTDSNVLVSSIGMKYYVLNSAIECPSNPMIYGANVTSTYSVYGDTLTYQCAPGFESTSSSLSISCQKDGTWSIPSAPCTKCAAYSSSFDRIPGKYFILPYPWMTWEPTLTGQTSYVTADHCKNKCVGRTDFTCVAVYTRPGECRFMWNRVEENIPTFSPYRTDSTAYDEYIRLCV